VYRSTGFCVVLGTVVVGGMSIGEGFLCRHHVTSKNAVLLART